MDKKTIDNSISKNILIGKNVIDDININIDDVKLNVSAKNELIYENNLKERKNIDIECSQIHHKLETCINHMVKNKIDEMSFYTKLNNNYKTIGIIQDFCNLSKKLDRLNEKLEQYTNVKLKHNVSNYENKLSISLEFKY